jgi:hypothetical protein
MVFYCAVDPCPGRVMRRVSGKLASCLQKLPNRCGDSHQGCAVICQRHLNKGNDASKAMYRGGGSIAIVGHARSALLEAQDPDDEPKRLLDVVKAYRGALAPTLRFTLDPVRVAITGEDDVICRIGWCGESPYLADQLVQQPTSEQKEDKEEATSQLEKAREFLNNVLAEGP